MAVNRRPTPPQGPGLAPLSHPPPSPPSPRARPARNRTPQGAPRYARYTPIHYMIPALHSNTPATLRSHSATPQCAPPRHSDMPARHLHFAFAGGVQHGMASPLQPVGAEAKPEAGPATGKGGGPQPFPMPDSRVGRPGSARSNRQLSTKWANDGPIHVGTEAS